MHGKKSEMLFIKRVRLVFLGRLGISIVACVVTVRMNHIYMWRCYNLSSVHSGFGGNSLQFSI